MTPTLHPDRQTHAPLVVLEPLENTDDFPHSKNLSIDAYELVLVKEGEGTLALDNHSVELHPRQVLLLSPGQVARWPCPPHNLSGYRLRIRTDFPAPVTNDPLFFCRFQFFYNIVTPTHFTVDAANFERHIRLFAHLQHELESPHSDREEMGWSYVSLLLVQLHRNYCTTYNLVDERRIHQEAYRFKSLVETHIRNLQKVEDYAEMMQLSRITINKAVRAQYGITASEFLKNRLASEIIRELLITGKPIAKISEDLLFSEPSSLIRFFRNKTGESPHAYRLANRM